MDRPALRKRREGRGTPNPKGASGKGGPPALENRLSICLHGQFRDSLRGMIVSRYIPLVVCCTVASFLPTLGFAQTTDLNVKVATLLTAYGPVPATNIVNVSHTQNVCRFDGPVHCRPHGGECDPTQECHNETTVTPQPQTNNSVLTATSITITRSDPVTYGAATETELPKELIVANFLAENCTPNSATPAFTLSTTFQTTSSISLSTSVTHASNSSLNVGFKFGEALSVGGSVSYTDGTTSSNTIISGGGTTVQTTRSGSQAVPANTFLMIQLQTWPVQYTVPFSTTVTVDGTVELE